MAHILVTTLGINWQIVPEIIGWTNPNIVDLYMNHPNRAEFERIRTRYSIEPVDTLWVITTKGPETDESLRKLRAWWETCAARELQCHIVRVSGVQDISSLAECRRMSEAIHQVVFRAHCDTLSNGSLILSLTGGRKTMSSDMQRAASFFGCRALIHIVGDDKRLKDLQKLVVCDFCKPLPRELADAVTPVVVGQHATSPLVAYWKEADLDLHKHLHSGLKDSANSSAHWTEYDLPIEDTPILDALEERLEGASNLAANHASRIIKEETTANFLALYSLPPGEIDKLKKGIFIGRPGDPEHVEAELALLRRLPKAELHCHLGGALCADDIIRVAESIQDKIDRYRERLSPWLDGWKSRLDQEDLKAFGNKMNWKKLRRPVPCVPEPIPVAAFVLLFRKCPDQLETLIYGPYLEEKNFVGIGFEPYERLGDLQGSALLQCEETLRAACRILGERAREHNVLHLEVRCSPQNYTRGGLRADEVLSIIADELHRHGPESTVLLLIGSRHREMKELQKSVSLANSILQRGGIEASMLVGFDLAGDEQALRAKDVREALLPIMERCLHITIHAGETADAGSIWEAVYHLNAERIGHGLTLIDFPSLLQRFRDRRIALEMCPSSNCQIVGFADSQLPSTSGLSQYPLAQYLQEGLRVTINTDNPGISRTDFSREYHRAGRLTKGGLSLWEILLIIRNGFKTAFTNAPKRHELLRKAERVILDVLARKELYDALR